MFRSPEQREFFDKILEHVRAPEQLRSFAKGVDGPLLLEGGSGLGVTRAGLMAAIETVKAGMRVALVLPTPSLLRRLVDSPDFKELLPEDLEWAEFPAVQPAGESEEVENAIEALREVPLLLCTSACVIFDRVLRGRYSGVTFRDYLIFDQADRLPEAALAPADCEINAGELRDLGVSGSNARDVASRIARTPSAPAEKRALAALILETFDEPAGYHTTVYAADSGLTLRHRMPGRLLRRVANNPNAAFIGASLAIGGAFDHFKRAMGIASHSNISAIIEPKSHGTLNCHHASYVPLSEDWFATLRSCVARSEKPCLVLTADDQQTRAIGTLLPGATLRYATDAVPKAADGAAAADHHEPVLIASAEWGGLDAPVEWRTIIISRIPIDSSWGHDEDAEDFYVDPRNRAIRRVKNLMRQGVRSPDAQCDLHVLDRRVGLFESMVPTRFRVAWAKRTILSGLGNKEQHVLERAIAAEQPMKAVREEVIKSLGNRCMACNTVPKPGVPLEIHLLRVTAAHQVRLSIKEEMAILCMSCHRLAHSADPPLSLEMLRGFKDIVRARS
jgi:hypothetical protein